MAGEEAMLGSSAEEAVVSLSGWTAMGGAMSSPMAADLHKA